MNTCDEITQSLYSTVTRLVDYYLPLMTVKRHTTDKPMSAVRNEDWPGDAISCVPKSRAADVEDVAAEVLRQKTRGPGGVASSSSRARQSTVLSR